MKTIRLFFALVITLLSVDSYSQNSNEFRLYFGTSDAELLKEPMLGGAGYQNEKINEFGIKYLRQFSPGFSIETGINYSKRDIKITPEFMGTAIQSRYEKLEIVSVAIYANYTFWRYIFVNGGPIIDFQLSDNSTDSESGIGFGIGVGAKYNFSKFLVFINPNLKRHSILSFEKENYDQNLTEFGVQIGVGYKF
ncbi:outer membrane beta-barrel protein [Flavobacterium sp. Arc3]|uniref:outer membrane beta-barrel protein n=1 Tax=Flavobacterium sp. Arc3 TaxID=3046686 RepID=UPI00352BD871